MPTLSLPRFHETHDPNNPTATASPSWQRSQVEPRDLPATTTLNPPLHPAPASPRPSSAASSVHTLRRTPRLGDRVPTHRRSRSLDSAARQPEQHPSSQPHLAHVTPIGETQPDPSDVATEVAASTSSWDPLEEPFWPRRSTRISPRTASAILFALEEAIRKPYLFTPDLLEESASMSDLLSAAHGPGQTGNNGRSQNGGYKASGGPVPVPSYPTAGLRTPTDIMRQRQAREARKKQEQEDRERELTEERQRLQAMQQRPMAGTADDSPTQRRSTKAQQAADIGQDLASGSRRQERGTAGGSSYSRANPPNVMPTTAGSSTSKPIDPTVRERVGQSTGRIRGSSVSQGQPRPVSSSQTRVMPTAQDVPDQPMPQSGGQTYPPASAANPLAPEEGSAAAAHPRSRSGFPHAFERWETLSSHWEGLTSYWIRKLEQNSEELSRDPLSQQMSRQITDLSAAGANLFHAVVELQRLRASSERKFQRWFFDTRTEQEKFQETQAEMDRIVKEERQRRGETMKQLARAESDKAKAEELVREMRRELQISKDEARRAWEELGRRAQEERDRTTSLRSGEPTLVGGVQVVPMVQGMSTRQPARPETREGPYSEETGPNSMGGHMAAPEQQYNYEAEPSLTGTNPYQQQEREETQIPEPSERSYVSSPGRQPPTSAAAMAATLALQNPTARPHPEQVLEDPEDPSHFYHHTGTDIHHETQTRTSEPDDRSYIPSTVGTESDLGEEEWETDAQGNYRLDARGNPIPYRRQAGRAPSVESDEYGVDDQLREQGIYPSYTAGGQVQYGSGPTSGVAYDEQQEHEHGQEEGIDYSGSGWGQSWESYTPRHRHPTRLSDVPEEDERSRTSPSRASQASRSMR